MTATTTETTYAARMRDFEAHERAVQSKARSVAELEHEHVRISAELLRGNLTEQEALERVDRLEQERQRLRLYHPAAVRMVVDEIRAERETYTKSRSGQEAKREYEQAQIAEMFADSDGAKADRRNAAIRAEHAAKQANEKAARERFEREKQANLSRLRAAAEVAEHPRP